MDLLGSFSYMFWAENSADFAGKMHGQINRSWLPFRLSVLWRGGEGETFTEKVNHLS